MVDARVKSGLERVLQRTGRSDTSAELTNAATTRILGMVKLLKEKMSLAARAKGGDMRPTWCDRLVVAQIVVQAAEPNAGDSGLIVAEN